MFLKGFVSQIFGDFLEYQTILLKLSFRFWFLITRISSVSLDHFLLRN